MRFSQNGLILGLKNCEDKTGSKFQQNYYRAMCFANFRPKCLPQKWIVFGFFSQSNLRQNYLVDH